MQKRGKLRGANYTRRLQLHFVRPKVEHEVPRGQQDDSVCVCVCVLVGEAGVSRP